MAQFGRQRASAIRNYIQFVHEGARLPSVWTQLQGQIFLGSEACVKKMQAQIDKSPTLAEGRSTKNFPAVSYQNDAVTVTADTGVVG